MGETPTALCSRVAAVHVKQRRDINRMDAAFDIKPNYSNLNGHKDGVQSQMNGHPMHSEHFQDDLIHTRHPNGSNGISMNPHDVFMDDGGLKNELDERPFPSMEELEKELPFVVDGQVHLGLVMHQMVQDLYSQLLNIAETYVHSPSPSLRLALVSSNCLANSYSLLSTT